LLACVALTDEFWSGVAVVAAPEVEREQGLGHGGYALLVFALPLLGAALLEAAIALVSDRYPRRRLVRLALFATAGSLLGCAFASAGVWLAVGLALAGTACGSACAVAQAELVTACPAEGARALTRWVLCGAIGDVLTPLLVALILRVGGSYRGAFVIAALQALVHGALLARDAPEQLDAPAPRALALDDELDAEEASEPLLVALRVGARDRQLWFWLLGASLCTFLDEIVIALASLHAERDLGAAPAAAVACVTGTSVGGVFGAWLTERLLGKLAPDRVLCGSAAAALGSLVAVVAAPSVFWLAPALFLLGASAAPQYALLMARAYAASPARPGVVNALAQVFVLVDVVGPLAFGAVADAQGVGAALLCLAVQPLGVLLLLLREAARRGGPE
jgi:MFS family permease